VFTEGKIIFGPATFVTEAMRVAHAFSSTEPEFGDLGKLQAQPSPASQ
jgi:hypothetical protein